MDPSDILSRVDPDLQLLEGFGANSTAGCGDTSVMVSMLFVTIVRRHHRAQKRRRERCPSQPRKRMKWIDRLNELQETSFVRRYRLNKTTHS